MTEENKLKFISEILKEVDYDLWKWYFLSEDGDSDVEDAMDELLGVFDRCLRDYGE